MPGFSTITGDESIMFTDNASFDGTQRGGKMTTNGQLWIGSTAAAHVKLGTITSPSGTITVGYSSPNITLDLSGGTTAIDSVAVDAATAPGTNPVLPTVAGLITVTGAQVATGVVGTNVIRTDSLAANTYTIEIQRSTTAAVSTVADNGVSHFNSGQFTVDSNGFVSLVGGAASTNFTVDAFTAPGTNPVLPNGSGNVIVTGAQVAAGVVGTNVIRTDSLAANTYTIEIQRSQAVASTTLADNGVCHFNSGQFTVDANGFVSLAGGGQAIDSIAVDASTAPGTNPVLPTVAGLITVTGAQVPAGTVGANVIRTDSLAANTYTIEIQRSTTNATSDATKNGVSHFNSAQFTVDADGFVSAIASAFTWIDQATSITLAVNTGYFVTAATTQTLPAAPTQGQTVKIIADTTGAVVVTANTGQLIRVGNVVSSTAGSMTSTLRGDSLELVFRAATSTWISIANNGVWVAA